MYAVPVTPWLVYAVQIQNAGDGSTARLVELQGQLSAKEAEVAALQQAVEQGREAAQKVCGKTHIATPHNSLWRGEGAGWG